MIDWDRLGTIWILNNFDVYVNFFQPEKSMMI